jgi:hypothetical protein
MAMHRALNTAPITMAKKPFVMGSGGLLLPVSLKRLDANTVVATYKRGGQVVAISRRVVSKDGRKMTITTNSPDQLGKNVRSIGVYEKAKEVADMERKIAK